MNNEQNKLEQNELIVIGKFGAPFGVKGWIKVLSYTEARANILDYQPWYVPSEDTPPIPVELPMERSAVQNGNVIVKLMGVESPEQARILNGKIISAARKHLPSLKQDEYYWSDLEGLTVINQRGEVLGKVTYLMATGSNDVLVVEGAIQRHAIPYLLGSVVTQVDLTKQEIHVNWEVL